ncbi:hypothetical protein M3210_02780 [Oceanobacillus luteolus]|uniref:hypothetical protein n=1 Tax=Oceanobacillus luteolus TaxID=1274358 RepID=UPI00203B0D83|nr:hypothetical protein [Oceanobacillus luteolus]MCM3739187.1 hypothetical protein [Oceanobacillus luteolus]
MKKLLLIFVLFLSLVIAACGDSEDNADSNDASGASDETTEEVEETADKSEDATEEENEEEDTNENKTAEGHKIGDVITNEAGESTLVSLTNDVGTFESGPIVLTIEKANGVSMNVSDEFVDMFGGEELEYIQVDMTVENTSEDHITFYASQAVMTTSTGEQIEPDMLMSDHIDGEYLGSVTKSGTSFYILENSKAEDVESIKLFYDAAIDEEWENVGEKIEVEIPLNK